MSVLKEFRGCGDPKNHTPRQAARLPVLPSFLSIIRGWKRVKVEARDRGMRACATAIFGVALCACACGEEPAPPSEVRDAGATDLAVLADASPMDATEPDAGGPPSLACA